MSQPSGRQVLCGTTVSIVLTEDGLVYSTGKSEFGELGLGVFENVKNFTHIVFPGNVRIKSLFQGNFSDTDYFFALSVCGKLFKWGRDFVGHFAEIRTPLMNFYFQNKVIQTVYHSYSTFVVLTNGDVFCFGYNAYGQLGIGNASNLVEVPVKFVSRVEIVLFCCGAEHTIFHAKNGDVFAAGANGHGQLALAGGDPNIRTVLTEITFFKEKKIEVVDVRSGFWHNLFLCSDGYLYSNGYNSSGQLGIGLSVDSKHIPVLITSLKNVVVQRIECCANTTMVFSKEGELYVWGDNRGEKVMSSHGETIAVPTLLQTSFVLRDFSVGWKHGLYLSFDGKLFGKGSNEFGQLGATGAECSTFENIGNNLNFGIRSCDKVNREERFNYLTENTSFADLELRSSTTIMFKMFKSNLISSKMLSACRNGSLEIQTLPKVDREAFLKTFYGLRVSKHTDLNFLMSFCKLCDLLDLEKYLSVVLRLISDGYYDMKDLLLLFYRSCEIFEDNKTEMSKEDEIIDLLGGSTASKIEISHPFNINLFNIFKQRFEEIQNDINFHRVLEKMGMLSNLKQHDIQTLTLVEKYNHRSFYSAFLSELKVMYEKRDEFYNYIIISSDQKQIRCHREVLIMESDYFYRVIKFGGNETRKDGYLILERMNHQLLSLVVEFVYLKQITQENLPPLIDLMMLLNEVGAYEETVLEKGLISLIIMIAEKQVLDGQFLKNFSTFAFIFHEKHLDFNEKFKKVFLSHWTSEINSNYMLINVVEASYENRLQVEQNENLLLEIRKENEKLKMERDVLAREKNDRMIDLEKENENLKKVNEENDKKIAELEELLSLSDNRKRKRKDSSNEEDESSVERKKRKVKRVRKNKRERENLEDDKTDGDYPKKRTKK